MARPIHSFAYSIGMFLGVVAGCSNSARDFGNAAGGAGQGGATASEGGAHEGGAHEGGAHEGGAQPGSGGKAPLEEAGGPPMGESGAAGAESGNGGAAQGCSGQRTCADNHCVPQAGCCADAECANGFACVAGACSVTQCQAGQGKPCKGKCITGCCVATDCPDGPNGQRSCNAAHSCEFACKTDFADCDTALGCEVDTRVGQVNGTKVNNCGACGVSCNFTNPAGGSSCATHSNSCAAGECSAKFNYIGDDVNGYNCKTEQPHATLIHGDCDVGCSYTCSVGWNDCDNDPSNGCETPNASVTGTCSKQPFWAGSF